jgi:hypothetical protein
MTKTNTSGFQPTIRNGSAFTLQNIPFGVISTHLNPTPRCAIAVGDFALDLRKYGEAGHLDGFDSILQKSLDQVSLQELPMAISVALIVKADFERFCGTTQFNKNSSTLTNHQRTEERQHSGILFSPTRSGNDASADAHWWLLGFYLLSRACNKCKPFTTAKQRRTQRE